MNKALLLMGGIAVGASAIILARSFRPPVPVDKEKTEKNKKRNMIIGGSAMLVGVVLIGVSAKMGAFKK
jgi:hypothetical protein